MPEGLSQDKVNLKLVMFANSAAIPTCNIYGYLLSYIVLLSDQYLLYVACHNLQFLVANELKQILRTNGMGTGWR